MLKLKYEYVKMRSLLPARSFDCVLACVAILNINSARELSLGRKTKLN